MSARLCSRPLRTYKCLQECQPSPILKKFLNDLSWQTNKWSPTDEPLGFTRSLFKYLLNPTNSPVLPQGPGLAVLSSVLQIEGGPLRLSSG